MRSKSCRPSHEPSHCDTNALSLWTASRNVSDERDIPEIFFTCPPRLCLCAIELVPPKIVLAPVKKQSRRTHESLGLRAFLVFGPQEIQPTLPTTRQKPERQSHGHAAADGRRTERFEVQSRGDRRRVQRSNFHFHSAFLKNVLHSTVAIRSSDYHD